MTYNDLVREVGLAPLSRLSKESISDLYRPLLSRNDFSKLCREVERRRTSDGPLKRASKLLGSSLLLAVSLSAANVDSLKVEAQRDTECLGAASEATSVAFYGDLSPKFAQVTNDKFDRLAGFVLDNCPDELAIIVNTAVRVIVQRNKQRGEE